MYTASSATRVQCDNEIITSVYLRVCRFTVSCRPLLARFVPFLFSSVVDSQFRHFWHATCVSLYSKILERACGQWMQRVLPAVDGVKETLAKSTALPHEVLSDRRAGAALHRVLYSDVDQLQNQTICHVVESVVVASLHVIHTPHCNTGPSHTHDTGPSQACICPVRLSVSATMKRSDDRSHIVLQLARITHNHIAGHAAVPAVS